MSSTVDRYLMIAFVLIALYLVLANRQGFSSAISGLGALNIGAIGVFQGRCTDAFGVKVGCGGPVGVTNDPVITFPS